MRLAPIPGYRKACLWCVVSSVPPAREKYSPREMEVGMQIRGIVGGLTFVGGVGSSTE
jgi:hypothetical protein